MKRTYEKTREKIILSEMIFSFLNQQQKSKLLRRKAQLLYPGYHTVRIIKSTTVYVPSSELGLRQRVFPSPQKWGGGGTLAFG